MSKIVLRALPAIAMCAVSVRSEEMALQGHPLVMVFTGANEDVPFQFPATFEYGDAAGRSYAFQFTFAHGKEKSECDLDVEPPKFDVTGIKGVVERRMY